MTMRLLLCASVLLAAAGVAAEDAPAPQALAKVDVQASAAAAPREDAGEKTLSGMSILGNQEAPKALVIVPWKSSQLGDTLGISRTLDDGRQPVDRDVFMRELTYYEIRSGGE